MDAAASSRSNAARHAYFPEIDGMRAVAVLAVLVFHLRESFLPGGFLGVDIFFVISGFVVTQSIKDTRFSSFLGFLSHFYARRLFRIFPLLGVVVLATTLAFVLFVPEAWLSRDIGRVGMAAIVGLSNIVLSKGNDYFSPSTSFNPFTHTWSLGVEEQFYFIFPFVMYFGLRGGGRLRVGIVAALVLASLVVGWRWTEAQPLRAFYLLPSRFWELGAGMLLCLTVDRWKPLLQAQGRALALVVGSALLLALGLVMPPMALFPVPWAILPVLGTLGVIAGTLARPDIGAAGVLRAGPVLWVGRLSYSLYLWHWPVYVIMRWTVGLDDVLDMAIAVLVTTGLSVLGYRFIEAPARNWQRREGAGLRPIATAALAAGCVTLIAGGLFYFKPQLTLSTTGNLAIWYPETEALELPAGQCQVAETKEDVDKVHVSIFTPTGCASPQPAGRLFVTGDSHTDHYARLLKRFAYETGREVRMYSLPGCGMVTFAARPGDARCQSFEERLTKDLAGLLTPDDILFLPTLRIPRYIDQWGETHGQKAQPASPAPALDREGHAEDVTRQILRSGARIVFEAPTPVFRSVPFRCADWFNRMNAICDAGFSMPVDELQARRAPVLDAMRAVAARVPRVEVWDPFPILCPDQTCDVYRDGKPLFFDQDHLSGVGNDLLLPSFTSAMTAFFDKNRNEAPAAEAKSAPDTGVPANSALQSP